MGRRGQPHEPADWESMRVFGLGTNGAGGNEFVHVCKHAAPPVLSFENGVDMMCTRMASSRCSACPGYEISM